jgi:hypothetical protein
MRKRAADLKTNGNLLAADRGCSGPEAGNFRWCGGLERGRKDKLTEDRDKGGSKRQSSEGLHGELDSFSIFRRREVQKGTLKKIESGHASAPTALGAATATTEDVRRIHRLYLRVGTAGVLVKDDWV